MSHSNLLKSGPILEQLSFTAAVDELHSFLQWSVCSYRGWERMFYPIKANKVTTKLLSCLLLLQTTCWSDHLQHQVKNRSHNILFSGKYLLWQCFPKWCNHLWWILKSSIWTPFSGYFFSMQLVIIFIYMIKKEMHQYVFTLLVTAHHVLWLKSECRPYKTCDMTSDYWGFVRLSPSSTFKVDWCISLALKGFWGVFKGMHHITQWCV